MAALTGCGFRTGLTIGFDGGFEDEADASTTADGGELDASEDDGGGEFDLSFDGGFEDDLGVPDGGFEDDLGVPFDGAFEDDAGRLDAGSVIDAGRVDAGRPDASIPTDSGVVSDASRPDAGRDASTPVDSGIVSDASRPDAGRDASTPTDSGVVSDASTPVDATVPRDSGFTFPDSGIPGPTPCMTDSQCSPVGPVEQVCWTDIGFCAPRCDALPGGAFSICSLLGNGSVCDPDTGACVIP